MNQTKSARDEHSPDMHLVAVATAAPWKPASPPGAGLTVGRLSRWTHYPWWAL